MLYHLAQRSVFTLIVLFLSSLTIFVTVQLPPGGTPVRPRGAPVYVQYLTWVNQIISEGDFGWSRGWRQPVGELIRERILLTVIISLSALLLTYVIAIPVSLYSATHPYTWLDTVLSTLGLLGMAIPNFLLALLILVFLSRTFGLIAGGLFSPEYLRAPWSAGKVMDLLAHLPLPVVVVGTASTATVIRVLRATLMDELERPYVKSARARGLSEVRLLLKYPVRMALNPVVSTIGTMLPLIVSGSVITAIVLGLPTVGPLLVRAILEQDTYLAAAILLLLSVLTIVGNALSDVLLAALDPRIRFMNRE